MRVPVVPFLTPPDGSVSHGGWQIFTADGVAPLPSEMLHWDYQTSIDLAAALFVDRSAVTQACALESSSGLTVLVTAHSDHTRSERPVARLEVPQQDRFDLAIRFDLAGDELGGRLTLNTLLVVTEPRPLDDLAPSRPGSIIWRTQHRTHLQGIGAQFPTDAADFSMTRQADPKAGWELKVDLADGDALFMSAARLTLNSGHPTVARMLQGQKNDLTVQMRRTLHWDVTRQLVAMALASDEVISAEFDPDATSVTGVLRNLLASIWPKDSPVTVRRWWETNPSRVELRLQGHCELIG